MFKSAQKEDACAVEAALTCSVSAAFSCSLLRICLRCRAVLLRASMRDTTAATLRETQPSHGRHTTVFFP